MSNNAYASFLCLICLRINNLHFLLVVFCAARSNITKLYLAYFIGGVFLFRNNKWFDLIDWNSFKMKITQIFFAGSLP